MKKIIALALVCVSLAATLAACGGKTGTCGLCGKENVSVKTLTYEGESADFCSECYDGAKAIIDLAGSIE